MQLADARRILGLGPDEDPQSHLPEFQLVRERIAEMVRAAPNEALALRYQQGLVEFDQALAAVREHLEATKSAPPPVPPPACPFVPVFETAEEAEAAEEPAARRGKGILLWICLLFLLAGAGGAGWFYLKIEDDKRLQKQQQLITLERQGALFIEDRRWPEATQAFKAMEALEPGSPVAQAGLRSIEAGKIEEDNQFIAYSMGEARAALEGGRWDAAERTARQLLLRFPDETDAIGLLAEIDAARQAAARDSALATIRERLENREWDLAIAAAEEALVAYPDDDAASSLLAAALAGREKMLADRAKARELFKLAAARDSGVFDQETLDWLREAAALAPEDAEIAAKLEQVSAYVRTLRVPEEFANPAEAMAEARDRDRIIIGPGKWQGPFVVNAGVELQGDGSGTTVFHCDANLGCALTFGPGAKGAHVSGLAFQHDSFDAGPERFSAVLVRAGSVTFADCHFSDASGHGLLVVEGGRITASRCRFSQNGWNGVAAMDEGSLLEVRESQILGNFGHGIEAWDGASVILTRNRCEGNSRNGIHTDGRTASATIEGNQLLENREFGLVLGGIASGRAAENVARGNLLGGFVIRASAGSITVTGNQAVKNHGPGMILERGLVAGDFASNSSTGNQGHQVLSDADLATAADDPELEPVVGEDDPVPAEIEGR